MTKTLASLLMIAALGCAPDPVLPGPCEAEGHDWCAELAEHCAFELSGFEQRLCRSTVAEDDWCACKEQLPEEVQP